MEYEPKIGWHIGKPQKQQDWGLKRTLKRVTTGTGLSKISQLVDVYNCNSCSWRDSPLCPHGLKDGQVHSNKICSQRVLWLKETFKIAGSKTKFLQMDEAVKLKVLSDKMMMEWAKSGELHKNFHHISKNMIQLLDKMRRQDEGIKVNAQIDVTHNRFRELVDEAAEELKKKNDKPNILDAEFEDKQEV